MDRGYKVGGKIATVLVLGALRCSETVKWIVTLGPLMDGERVLRAGKDSSKKCWVGGRGPGKMGGSVSGRGRSTRGRGEPR